jgi:hypothetical protein
LHGYLSFYTDGLGDALGETLVDGDGEILALVDALGVGLWLPEGELLADGDSDKLVLDEGEREVEMEADGDGLTDGDPATTSIGASTTAKATRTTSSVCQASSTSSVESVTRRRNESQRRLVKVGTVASRVRISLVPLGTDDCTRRKATVPSK